MEVVRFGKHDNTQEYRERVGVKRFVRYIVTVHSGEGPFKRGSTELVEPVGFYPMI